MYVFGSGREVLRVRGMGLGFTNPGGTGGKSVCVCVLVAVVLGGVAGRLGPGYVRVLWC